MPRIPDEFIHCVIYLYPDRFAAQEGLAEGGTGFLVGVMGREGVLAHLYVVTNSHVVKEGKCSILRVTASTGGVELIDIPRENWIFHPYGDDVAIAPYRFSDRHQFAFIPEQMFISQDDIVEHGVGPGMEAFMLGRLIGMDGKLLNKPSARFGHLAMMNEPVVSARGIKQDSFIVELQSLGGYSGSPVFLYPAPFYFSGDKYRPFNGPKLLGINWGHYPATEIVKSGSVDAPIKTEYWIQPNIGIAAVIPAWKIQEMLQDEGLVAERKAAEEHYRLP